MPIRDLPRWSLNWAANFKAMHDWCDRYANGSLLRGCLNFVYQTEEVSKVIVGVTSEKELQQILEAVQNISCSPNPPENFYTNNEMLVNPSNWPRGNRLEEDISN